MSLVGDLFQVHIIGQTHVLCVNAEDLEAANGIGNANVHLTIEATESAKSLIEKINMAPIAQIEVQTGSMLLGLFVAAITITCERDFKPSISVRSWDTMRFSTSPLVFSRFGAMESSSAKSKEISAFA